MFALPQVLDTWQLGVKGLCAYYACALTSRHMTKLISLVGSSKREVGVGTAAVLDSAFATSFN